MKKASTNVSALQIEWICMQVFAQLLKRHFRYLLVIIPMYVRTVFGPVRCHVLRAAYCFARYLDDVLDGDIQVNEPQKEYVNHLLDKMKEVPVSDMDQQAVLGKYVFEHIDKYKSNGSLPSHELNILINAMIYDRERADRRLILSRKELDQHQLETFLSALHVTLDVTGARYQTRDIVPLARAQGSLYTLRDLKKDLEESINNIPQNVLVDTKLPPEEYWNMDRLIETKAFRDWIYDEFNRGILQVIKIRQILETNSDFNFKATVKPLYKGLKYLTRRLQKEYNFL